MAEETYDDNLATLVAATIALIAAVLAHSPVQANDISVGGGRTITDAIAAATTDTAVGSCSAGSGADTVILETNGLYTLTTGNTFAIFSVGRN